MNCRKRLCSGFVLLVLLCSKAPVVLAEQGLLWKIEKGSASPSYLFGTMHSDDPQVTALPQPVQQALDSASRFMMEVELDPAAIFALAQAMLFQGEKTLRDVLDQKLFDRTMQVMGEHGIPAKVAERMRPWAVVTTLSTPAGESGQALDLVLYQRALTQNKKISGLESLEEQISIFQDLSVVDQVALLQDTLEQYPLLPQYFEQLKKAYLSRDLERLVALSEESMARADPALRQRLMNRLIDKRNRRMVERMVGPLATGEVFVAVGALHLPGPAGIIELLREFGYRVTAVY